MVVRFFVVWPIPDKRAWGGKFTAGGEREGGNRFTNQAILALPLIVAKRKRPSRRLERKRRERAREARRACRRS